MNRYFPCSALKSMSAKDRLSIPVSDKSTFQDNVWDFSVTEGEVHYAQALIDFRFDEKKSNGAEIANVPLLDSIKCLVYSLIFDPPRSKLKICTIGSFLKSGHGIYNLYKYLSKNDYHKFGDFSEMEFLRFLEETVKRPLKTGKPLNDRSLVSRLRGIEYIFEQGPKLQDGLVFRPWAREGGLRKWVARCAIPVVCRDTLSTQPLPDKLVAELFRASLLELGRADNLKSALMISAARRELSSRKKQNKIIEDRPFLAQLGYKNLIETNCAFTRLRGAVAFLIGIFSGMRSGEIRFIEANCHETAQETVRIGESELKVYFISSKYTKTSAVPELGKWQTVPLVIQAIKILTEINALCPNPNLRYLFKTFGSTQGKVSHYGERVASAQSFVKSLQNLAHYHKVDLACVQGFLDSRDLRRTFARIVTRNGLGIIELQDQLRHMDPDITMKYAAPALREYLEGAKQDWAIDQYRELLAGTYPIIGGGAGEVIEMRNQFIGLTRGDRDAFLATLPRKAIIDQMSDGLCLYRAERALCKGNKSNCQPGVCENSVVNKDESIKTLIFRKAENTRLLRIFKNSPPKRDHLRRQLIDIEALLVQANIRI